MVNRRKKIVSIVVFMTLLLITLGGCTSPTGGNKSKAKNKTISAGHFSSAGISEDGKLLLAGEILEHVDKSYKDIDDLKEVSVESYYVAC